jgi:subtilisin family serine protease
MATKRGRGTATGVESANAPGALTVLYVHGIGNKPPQSILHCQWDTALWGYRLGEQSRLAYWVNRDRYHVPENRTCASADSLLGSSHVRVRNAERRAAGLPPVTTAALLAGLTGDADQKATLEAIARKIQAGPPERDGKEDAPRAPRGRRRARIIPFVGPIVRGAITNLVTEHLLPDVHDFLFDEARRDFMLSTVEDRLTTGGGPFVVIGHSLGSVIAYTALQRLSADEHAIDVRLFITLGSPLGMEEIREGVGRILNRRDLRHLPFPGCVHDWVNVNDRLDPVAIDTNIANDITDGAVKDLHVENPDGVLDAHSATGYLSTPEVRKVVREAVKPERFQRLAPVRMTKDLARSIDEAGRDERTEVLFELSQPPSGSTRTTDDMRELLVKHLREIQRRSKVRNDVIAIEPLRHYVAACLTRKELLETVYLTEFQLPPAGGIDYEEIERVKPFYRAWKNGFKVALINRSVHTLQVHPAHNAYTATGRDIHWAVLDSGISEDHPHFNSRKTIVASFDCTVAGEPPIDMRANGVPGNASASDRFGHGTHVAGIIAGGFQLDIEQAEKNRLRLIDRRDNADWGGVAGMDERFNGMAFEAKLHNYKTLGDDGSGLDSWIIKALDHIARTNERAGRLVIHGVNLSLGGFFDTEAFGCGRTPLCDELRRLWSQGVVVVLAAGNSGQGQLLVAGDSGNAEQQAMMMGVSIEDPANLEEAIAVGSVHRTKPNTYGVSFFSSRGPTADGRQKPDCVAPGEQIYSCRHDWKPRKDSKDYQIDDLYIPLDGTSMAAPHVSGLIAAFLSQRREFIGQPDKVKKILLTSCTDLGRDRTVQGAGLPNLVRMLVAT